MDKNKTPSGKPPKSPGSPHSPSWLTPQKRSLSVFGHVMDRETVTESGARRKFSRVEVIRTTHDDGRRAYLFKVPLHEMTTDERERAERHQRNAARLQERVDAAVDSEIFVLLALKDVENRALQSKNETLLSKIDALTARLDSLEVTVADLKSKVADQQIEIADQKIAIESLKATVADQQIEMGSLREIDYNVRTRN